MRADDWVMTEATRLGNLGVDALGENSQGNLDELPSLVQGVGIAVLTILIPLGIAILTEYFQKKHNPQNYAKLDLHVILDYVLNLKQLMAWIGLAFIPVVLWGVLPSEYHPIELIGSVIGILVIWKKLIDLYKWIKGNEYDFRFQYLNSLTCESKDIEVCFRSVWETNNINYEYEKKFFDIFRRKIDPLLNDENKVHIASKLLKDFSGFFQLRSSVFIMGSIEDVWEYNYLASSKYASLSSKARNIKYNPLQSTYAGVIFSLRPVLNTAIAQAFQNMEYEYILTFINDHFERHLTDANYLKQVVTHVFDEVMTQGEIHQKADAIFWDNIIPSGWKITEDNLNSSNPIALIVLECYMRRLEKKLVSSNPQAYDKVLEFMTQALFPNVDHMQWCTLLTYMGLKNWGYDLEAILKNKSIFGLISRVFVGSEEEYQNNEKENSRNTANLAIKVFGRHLNESSIDREILSLSSLDYNKGSSENVRKYRLIEVFNTIKGLLVNNTEGDDSFPRPDDNSHLQEAS